MEKGRNAHQPVVIHGRDEDQLAVFGPFPAAAGFPPGSLVLIGEKWHISCTFFNQFIPGFRPVRQCIKMIVSFKLHSNDYTLAQE